MNISEILPRTKVIIAVTNGSDMQARFMSQVVRNTGDALLCIPFRHKNKQILFDGDKTRIVLELRNSEGVLHNFKGCRITRVKKDGLVYHKIESSMKNSIENRRGGRRFFIGESCTVSIDGIDNPFFTKLRDLGFDGVAFVLRHDKTKGIREGKKFTLSFRNHEGTEVRVRGVIVRKEWLEQYMIYGCRLEDKDEELDKYVKYLEAKNTLTDVQFDDIVEE
ncbi:MAG: PilZ domain-containing protein [Lachnospiraceae bacterium]|nr:PilZ domain-containing protein [Lachnospiraceae bacterium]